MEPGETILLFKAIPSLLRLTANEKRGLSKFAFELSRKIGHSASFTCLITNDKTLHKLNREFLGHDYATDVLSFPVAAPGHELGEMAISIERASAQAAEHGHQCFEELQILMLHGLLHLTGLDHEKDRGKMARSEERWRAELGLPQSLLARAQAQPEKSTRAKDVA